MIGRGSWSIPGLPNWHERLAQRRVVRWELAANKVGTLERVTHSGLADLPISRQDYSGGWTGALDQIKKSSSDDFGGVQDMASMQITPDQDAIDSEIYIAAPPERVFQALVEPRQVLEWWGRVGVYRCTEFDCDLRVGGQWRSAGVGGGSGRFTVAGEYLEVDVPRVLVYSWVASWTGDVQTTVRWELTPDGDGTLVRLRHSGLAAHPEIAQSYRGWPRMLRWLKSFIEEGENLDMRKPISA